MPTAEQFAKFEEFWGKLWNYIYSIIAFLGYKKAEDFIDDRYPIPGITDQK